jgi:hypothetical protein
LTAMGDRWYDAQLGRWISADSIVPDPANPQSLNRFMYVLGNPLRYTDPTGHFTSTLSISSRLGKTRFKKLQLQVA